jgi:hypothetical protein
MEQYTLVLLKSGEKWNPSAPGFMDVIRQHHAVLQKMTEKGKIAVAGPFPLTDPASYEEAPYSALEWKKLRNSFVMIRSSKPDC